MITYCSHENEKMFAGLEEVNIFQPLNRSYQEIEEKAKYKF